MSKKKIKAYLTIDDITSDNTKAIIDYLCEKGIQAVLFAWGERVEKDYESAVYALQKGMIIGNHSYSHPQFSELSFEEGILEIERCEKILENLYEKANVERKIRLFRFPYGDKGGANKDKYQEYLRNHGFTKLDDRNFASDWWAEKNLDKDIDNFWTFDFSEYGIRKGSDFTKEDVIKRIDEFLDTVDKESVGKPSEHQLLIHAHDETEELVPEYYKLFIDYIIERGVEFMSPIFILR